MSIPVELIISPVPEVVDAAIDAYVSWREECAEVHEAYRRWSRAARADRTLAFCTYTAALEREESAAGVYADTMRRLGGAIRREEPPDRPTEGNSYALR